MSNSSLVNYTKISPNRTSPRNHKIDTITIHCVVGQCTVQTLGNIFAPASRQASSNYGIGYDGKIGMYCEEKDRSWCSSSAVNDNRAVTIEVASDTKEPYAVTDAAYKSLIKLVADICKRNGIKRLVWSTNKADRVNHRNGCNMTVHRDFANKSCPGTYLYNRHGQIAAEVNKLLGATVAEKPTNATVKKNVHCTGYATHGPSATYNKTYTVNASDGLNMRQAAGVWNGKIVTIPNKAKVRCYGYYSMVGNARWLCVEYETSTTKYTGFVNSAYLK